MRHATPTPCTRLLTLRPTSAARVTPPQDRAVSFNLLYEGCVLPRHAGLLSAVPTADPPLPAARARPQDGRMRADSGCSCPGIIPDNFILELVDHHHQGGQLSPAPKGALAAARTLAHSPSCHATLSTPPLSSLFDGATVPSQVPLVAASTSPPVGHAGSQPRPPSWRE